MFFYTEVVDDYNQLSKQSNLILENTIRELQKQLIDQTF